MKKLGRKLTLSKETIRELTDSELGHVVGADPTNGQGCTNSNTCSCATLVGCGTLIGCGTGSVSCTSCICQSGMGCVTDGCCG